MNIFLLRAKLVNYKLVSNFWYEELEILLFIFGSDH